MCWILIDFALLNTFANCDFYRFFEILFFLGNLYYMSMIVPLLLIPSWALAIAYRLPLMLICSAILARARARVHGPPKEGRRRSFPGALHPARAAAKRASTLPPRVPESDKQNSQKRGGDRLGSGHPQKTTQSPIRLYKAPKRLYKHMNIRQNPKHYTKT